MVRQAEFYHDPAAPQANSVRPTVFAATRNGSGLLLLGRRADSFNWELPGGKVDIGESAVDALVREVAEETGVRISVTGLSGVYTDPGHVMVYANGEVRQQFSLCFHALCTAGDPRPDHEEFLNVAWVSPDELDRLPIHPSMRLRIDHALAQPNHVHIG